MKINPNAIDPMDTPINSVTKIYLVDKVDFELNITITICKYDR